MSIALTKDATRVDQRRRIVDVAMRGLCVAATFLAMTSRSYA